MEIIVILSSKSINTMKKTTKKTKVKKCLNCKHKGMTFKFGKKTHLHCCHPAESENYDPWSTLQEISSSCEKHEFKEKEQDLRF